MKEGSLRISQENTAASVMQPFNCQDKHTPVKSKNEAYFDMLYQFKQACVLS